MSDDNFAGAFKRVHSLSPVPPMPSPITISNDTTHSISMTHLKQASVSMVTPREIAKPMSPPICAYSIMSIMICFCMVFTVDLLSIFIFHFNYESSYTGADDNIFLSTHINWKSFYKLSVTMEILYAMQTTITVIFLWYFWKNRLWKRWRKEKEKYLYGLLSILIIIWTLLLIITTLIYTLSNNNNPGFGTIFLYSVLFTFFGPCCICCMCCLA
eukprot:98520_1